MHFPDLKCHTLALFCPILSVWLCVPHPPVLPRPFHLTADSAPPLERVWPQSSAIVCSSVNKESSVLALGLENGVVVVCDVKKGAMGRGCVRYQLACCVVGVAQEQQHTGSRVWCSLLMHTCMRRYWPALLRQGLAESMYVRTVED